MTRRTGAVVVLVAMIWVRWPMPDRRHRLLLRVGRRPLRQFAYLKASNPTEDAHLGCGGSLTGHAGNSSALSADGNTIAVGAPHENERRQGHQRQTGRQARLQLRRGVRVHPQRRYRGAAGLHQGVEPGARAPISGRRRLEPRRQHAGGRPPTTSPARATGINGNQNDRSIPEAGAVYIFTRSGTHVVAAGVHQGLEHRQAGVGEGSPKATSSATPWR